MEGSDRGLIWGTNAMIVWLQCLRYEMEERKIVVRFSIGRTAFPPTQTDCCSIQWLLNIRRSGREAARSSVPSASVEWAHSRSTLLYIFPLNRGKTTPPIFRSRNFEAGWAASDEDLAGYRNSGPGFEPGTFQIQNGSTGQDVWVNLSIYINL